MNSIGTADAGKGWGIDKTKMYHKIEDLKVKKGNQEVYGLASAIPSYLST